MSLKYERRVGWFLVSPGTSVPEFDDPVEAQCLIKDAQEVINDFHVLSTGQVLCE